MTETLLERYKTIRDLTDKICKPLQVEDFVVQPVVHVSPPKWHMAHTTWFFEEFILSKYNKRYVRFHPRYDFLFNSYYDAVGARVPQPNRGNMSRPTVTEIRDYRAYVDHHIIELIPELTGEALGVLEVALHHEQQHQELLYADLKFILGHNPLFPPYDEHIAETSEQNEGTKFLECSGGNYEIGFKGEGFSYDNEREPHRTFLAPFYIRESLVKNEEYIDFIEAGGYTQSNYWQSDAWAWIHENNITAPLYWHKIDGVWNRYSLSGLVPVDLGEPLTHATYYEAAGFAEWANMRLPTEFEWEAASDLFPWGQRWEHTNSAYLPYPGFSKPIGALGEYNGKFMVNRMVLRGSSVFTPPSHSRKTYRNFFQPYFGWQFTGIRLCKK